MNLTLLPLEALAGYMGCFITKAEKLYLKIYMNI